MLRARADTPTGSSTTTYAFDAPTPDTGWGFALGDIDADQVALSATDATGAAVATAEIDSSFAGTFNYAGRADQPTWSTTTATLAGNAAALDTDGAAGWFEPDIRLTSLTLTFTRRAGFPVYQTWFVSRARPVGGTVEDVSTVGECPPGDATLRLLSPSGTALATTTPAADGSYSFGELATQAGYSVRLHSRKGERAGRSVELAGGPTHLARRPKGAGRQVERAVEVDRERAPVRGERDSAVERDPRRRGAGHPGAGCSHLTVSGNPEPAGGPAPTTRRTWSARDAGRSTIRVTHETRSPLMRHRFLTRPLAAVLLPLVLALTLVGTLFAAATSGCRQARPLPSTAPTRPAARRRGQPRGTPTRETGRPSSWCTARSPTPVGGTPLRRS